MAVSSAASSPTRSSAARGQAGRRRRRPVCRTARMAGGARSRRRRAAASPASHAEIEWRVGLQRRSRAPQLGHRLPGPPPGERLVAPERLMAQADDAERQRQAQHRHQGGGRAVVEPLGLAAKRSARAPGVDGGHRVVPDRAHRDAGQRRGHPGHLRRSNSWVAMPTFASAPNAAGEQEGRPAAQPVQTAQAPCRGRSARCSARSCSSWPPASRPPARRENRRRGAEQQPDGRQVHDDAEGADQRRTRRSAPGPAPDELVEQAA